MQTWSDIKSKTSKMLQLLLAGYFDIRMRNLYGKFYMREVFNYCKREQSSVQGGMQCAAVLNKFKTFGIDVVSTEKHFDVSILNHLILYGFRSDFDVLFDGENLKTYRELVRRIALARNAISHDLSIEDDYLKIVRVVTDAVLAAEALIDFLEFSTEWNESGKDIYVDRIRKEIAEIRNILLADKRNFDQSDILSPEEYKKTSSESIDQMDSVAIQRKKNIDREIRTDLSAAEETPRNSESVLLRRMSEKLLRRYFDRSLITNGLPSDDVGFYRCNNGYINLRDEGQYIWDPLTLPINNGEVFFAVDAVTDVQVFAIYSYEFDAKTKRRKAKVSIEGLKRKNAHNGIAVSLEEHTKRSNEYAYFGGTTIFDFSEPMQQRQAISAETNEWLNARIREKGKVSLVKILNKTGFGENRFFVILLNHADNQIVQILRAYYSRRFKNGEIKEYIVIDVDNRIDLSYCIPKTRKNDVLFQHENNIKTYMADSDATILYYDPVEKRIIIRYISEDGSPEIKINADHPIISIPFSAVISGDGQERTMTAYELGKCYFDGTCDFPRNVFKAMQIFEEDGNADSLYEAGYFLYRNLEFGDKEMAFEFLLRASLRGNREALSYVRSMLEEKIGDIDDLEQYRELCDMSKTAIEEKTGDFKALAIKCSASLYSMLAGKYYDKKEYSVAAQYDDQAVSLFTQMPPLKPNTWSDRELHRATYQYRLALDYFKSKQYELAEENLLDARRLVLEGYHLSSDWNCITVGMLHCKIMRCLASTYGEMHLHTQAYQLRQALVSRVRELMHTRAEDVLKGKEMDVAKKIVEENSHLLRRWFVNDLLDLGWSAYILGKDEIAEISAKEAIGEIGECDEYQEYLNDANQLISVIYASPNVRVKDSNLSKEIEG